MNSWERDYQTRNWEEYSFVMQSVEEKELLSKMDILPLNKFIVCGSSSPLAERIKDDSRRFYYDYEQISAGMDTVYGLQDMYMLKENWNEHKKGLLVMQICKGVTLQPPRFTYLVEKED